MILYALGKSSYGFIAKLFGVTPPAVQKWLKQEASILEDLQISAEIKEMEFDEMWHFVGSKKMDYQSRGSFYTANCCLGCRGS